MYTDRDMFSQLSETPRGVCICGCVYDVSMCVIVCIQTGIGSVSCQRRPEVCMYVYILVCVL
jgi:hypothetical protein